MDDLKVGAILRAVRIKARLRQIDVAKLAGVSQSQVSDLERGDLRRMTIGTARDIAAALGVRVELLPSWRAGEFDRLLDRDHAALAEIVVALLRSEGYEMLIEYSFNHFGERGSVDVIGWHATTRTLVVIELKSRIVDIQNLLSTMDRKARLVPPLLARECGWRAAHIGRLLVLPASTASRSAIGAHRVTFEVSFPARGRAIRDWLRSPSGELAGILFVRNIARGDAKRRFGPTQRVRRPRTRKMAAA